MEDYKEKLKEALNSDNTDYEVVRWIEQNFPELKESEDERIRKALIKYYSFDKDGGSHALDNITPKQIVAWLEKQGTPVKLSEEEQNKFAKGVLTSCALSFIDYLDAHKYEGKMCVSNGECEDIENAFHNAMWDRLHRYYCKYIEKQGEQKPVEWSVSDFRTWQYIVSDVLTKKDGIGQYLDSGECKKIAKYMQEEWSKKLSIEQKPDWKPTEEQLKQLHKYAIDNRPLTELYEQLKKL